MAFQSAAQSLSSAIMSKKEQVLVIEPPIGLSFICVNFSVCPTKAFSSDLTFTGPFTSAVSSYMKLKNPSDKKVKALTDLAPITRQTRTSSNNSEVKSEITFLQVCFKIKTTAPKRYCVKPNSGVVDPKDEVQIAVSLQPFE